MSKLSFVAFFLLGMALALTLWFNATGTTTDTTTGGVGVIHLLGLICLLLAEMAKDKK